MRATFFVVGEEVMQYPALIRRMADAGHSIQNHSWSHRDLSPPAGPRPRLSTITAQIERGADAVEAVIGERPTCFRPPYGHTDDRVKAEAERLGMTEWLWTIDSKDWKRPRPTSASIAQHVERELAVPRPRLLEGSALVLMHDGPPGENRRATVGAVTRIINDIHAKGVWRLELICPRAPA